MTIRNFTVKSQRPFIVRGNETSPVTGMRFENIKGTVKGRPFDVAFAPGLVLDKINVAEEK